MASEFESHIGMGMEEPLSWNSGMYQCFSALEHIHSLRVNTHTERVDATAFSSDGKRVVFGLGEGSVRVWDTSMAEVLNVCSKAVDWVRSVAFLSDGKRVVSSSDDKSVRVWDASTGEVLNMLEGHTSWIKSVAFSSDGRRIVSGPMTSRYECGTGEVLNILEGYTSLLISVTFSNDGRPQRPH